jgi:hypothetical protein
MKSWDDIKRELSLKYAKELFEQVCEDIRKDKLKLARQNSRGFWFAVAFASVVYLVSFLAGAAGFWLLLQPWSTVLHPGLRT